MSPLRIVASALVFLVLLNTTCFSSALQEHDDARIASEDERMAWWRKARFGMFIHWGLYAIPAGEWGDETGYGEWMMNTAQIPVEEYEQFVDQFNPTEFDADVWVRAAKDAGMKYIVITSKHHDGFCLFDSAFTDYDVLSTPFQRDILRELAAACQRHGLKMCWYHSIMDWHHPDYLPRRGWETRPAHDAKFDRYVQYLRNQVTELLSNYGEIGVMWFDGQWEGTWTHEYGQPLYDLCLTLQPNVIVNDRVDKGRKGHSGVVDDRFAGDYGTPEQHIPATGLPGVDWETCMTMNRHWGFNKNDDQWKSTETLIRNLVDIASKGGNYLLNVGPKADGTFPEESITRMREIGNWMDVNSESIHGTTASPFDNLEWGRCTVNSAGSNTTLYLHVFDWPDDGRIVVPGIGNVWTGAHLLADPNTALVITRQDSDIVVNIPSTAPDAICSVIALEIKGAPIVFAAPKIIADVNEFVRPLTVRIDSGSDDLVVHYTLDGSTPILHSPRYEQPIVVDQSVTLNARSFFDERAVTPVVSQRFRKIEPRPGFGNTFVLPGLECYVLDRSCDVVPVFEDRRGAGDLTFVDKIELPSGPAVEYVVRTYVGRFKVDHDDVYRFALTSDDGSKLFIDDELVVNNDGLHGPETKTGSIALGEGWHSIRVSYFNKTDGAALSLEWATPGEPFTEVSDSAFARWHRR